MNPVNTLSQTQNAQPGDVDVALARLAGIMAAHIGRVRLEGDPGPELLVATEVMLWHLIDALPSLVPEYRGLSPIEIARKDGFVGLVARLTKLPPEVLGKHVVRVLFSVRLSLLAVERGAVLLPTPQTAGLLEALFQPVHRRAARRYLAEFSANTDLGMVMVDFAAAWRFGTPPIRGGRIAPANFEHLTGSQFVVVMALATFLFAADSWIVRANPVDVLFRVLVSGGAERWQAGSAAFKRAVTEALLVATRGDIALDELGKEPTAWDRVLSEETVDWASSVLLAFIHITGTPSATKFSLVQFLKDLERRAHKAAGAELIEEHVRRLGRTVVNLDAVGVEIGLEDDRIAAIPGIQDIRNHLRRTPLSNRERQVLALHLRDLDYQTIGDRLGMTASTARVCMLRVRRAAGQQRLASSRNSTCRPRRAPRK